MKKRWFLTNHRYLFACGRKFLKIMKISVFIVVFASMQTFALDNYAQTKRMDVKIEESGIVAALEKIEAQSEFFFFYNNKVVKLDKIVSVDLKHKTINEILDALFKDTDIEYTINNRQIILSGKETGSTLSQQQKSVSGKVTDSSGGALPGVTVVVKGTTNGTITDANGNYSLSNIPANANLQFSFVGMKAQDVAVNEKTIINVTLAEDAIGIEEVVAVGYGTQKKSDVTGSIVSIKAVQMRDISAISAANALQGKAAGIDIVASGQKPGDGSTIRIRGTRSFSASNDPLYIIDGIPFNRWINDLNPSDIESIEILKDASATAIYGSRGANGVILITTKNAKAGKGEISYDAFYGFQSAQKAYDMMDGAEYLELLREAGRASSLYPQDGSANLNDDLKLMKYRDQWTDQSVSMAYKEDGVYHPERVRSFDWGDAALQTGNMMNHQINFTGGNEKAKVMVSAGYYNEKGIIKGQNFERFSFRVNAEYNVNSWLKIGGSTVFTPSTKNAGSDIYYNATSINPLAIPFDEEGYIIDQPTKDSYVWNIYYDFDRTNYVSEQRRYRFMGSYFVDLNLGHGFKYRMNFGPDFGFMRDGNFAGTKSWSRKGTLSTSSESSEQYMTYVLENLLYYKNTFGKHHIGTILMQSMERERQETLGGNVSDLPYEHQQFYNLGSAGTITGVGSSLLEWRMLSYMGRFNYSFDEKYLLTLTGRVDGASRLAQGHKYTFFPSAALAWRISQEDFLHGITSLDNLKLRLGYGQTGNSSVSPYGTLGGLLRTTYSTDDTPAYGYRPNLLYNPNLAWEKTKQFNAGIDFSFFKGRIAGTVDGYRQITTDLLLSRQLPTASGFSSITENVGSTRNTGLEISLNTVNIELKNGLKWTTDLMFYTNKEEIVSLYHGKVDDVGNKWFIGLPIVTHYDYKFDGVWQNTPEDLEKMTLINQNGGTFKTGQIKIADIDPNDKITSNDRSILGSTVPKWTGSMTNTLSYKGLDFAVFIYARYGQMIQSSSGRLTLDTRTNSLDVNFWTPTNSSNEYPRPDRNEQSPPYISTLTYEDGSFLKFKNLTLGYSLPSPITRKIMMHRCRLYVTIENPYVFTNYTGLDPENGSSRSGETTTPSTKRLLFGLNVTF
jgi:TonB-linked SusC/RagA family outer membrane protein